MAEVTAVMPNAPAIRVARNGLTELYRPPDDKAVDAHIIFVHGLFGSPDKTWTNGASGRTAKKDDGRGTSRHPVFWPRELLPKIVPQTTVHTWGYDADVDNFMQPASRNSVYQHAGNLLTDLCDLRDTFEDKTIPFIFIAHSLGGLIVKDALNRSSSEVGTRIKDVAPHTFAVCFLGTPHRGSKLAKSGTRAITLKMLTSSRQPNVKLMQALQQNSEILDRIGSSFFQTVDKHGFRIASFCEEKEIRLLMIINLFIVEPDSAKIGLSKEETGTIPADHRNMAKFDSESDTGFSRVSKTIKRWVGTTVSSRKDEYQDCLQSLKIPEAGSRYQQVAKNYDRTFGWLFEKDSVQFIDWLREANETGPAGRLFWITGKPGSGKSTMMKYAIRNSGTMHHLQASGVREWHLIPFFFSDRGSEKQRAFQTMLHEILHQLLSRLGNSFDCVLPLYTRLCKTQKTNIPKWDLAELCEGISEVIVKSSSKAGICLFMDALDEHSGNHANLCKFFWDLSSRSGGSILLKICLASRPWPVFQEHFRCCRGFAIHEHTENDIRNYVTSRLYESSRSIETRHIADETQIREKTAMSELAEDVTSNAQGVFIWVRLVIDELCQGLTDGTPIPMLKKVLEDIPHELEDLYTRALRKIRWAYTVEAHIILHMVLTSLSPLPPQTLFDCVSWLFMGMVDPQEPEVQASRLASRTGGLLETVNSDGSSIVQFIHQTAKEYVRSHGGRLSLKYTDTTSAQVSANFIMFYPSSPLQPIRDEFSSMEGPEFLLLCGVRKPSCSGLIVRHLFAYAEEVDRKLPELSQNRKNLALGTLSSILDNESLWPSSSGYIKLKSFTAGPSRVELAVAANWKNLVTAYYNDEDFTKIAYLAALGPSLLDNFTGRIELVETLIDGKQWLHDLSQNPFGYTRHEPRVRHPPAERLSRSILRSDRMRMLSSVGADAYDILTHTTLLRTLVSIKSHPFVSESERIKMGALLLENGANAEMQKFGQIIMHFDGHTVTFRSTFSFCFHACSVGWVNLFLKYAEQPISSFQGQRESLAHCLASSRAFEHSNLRAALLREIFRQDETDLRAIPDRELLGVGWPLIFFVSQCGIVGFPHINRGFCSSGDHQRDERI